MAMKSSNPNGIDNFIRFSKINKDKYDIKRFNFGKELKLRIKTKINYVWEL